MVFIFVFTKLIKQWNFSRCQENCFQLNIGKTTVVETAAEGPWPRLHSQGVYLVTCPGPRRPNSISAIRSRGPSTMLLWKSPVQSLCSRTLRPVSRGWSGLKKAPLDWSCHVWETSTPGGVKSEPAGSLETHFTPAAAWSSCWDQGHGSGERRPKQREGASSYRPLDAWTCPPPRPLHWGLNTCAI